MEGVNTLDAAPGMHAKLSPWESTTFLLICIFKTSRQNIFFVKLYHFSNFCKNEYILLN